MSLVNKEDPLVEYNGLIVPTSYVKANEHTIKAACNGCGAGGWKFDIVPDSMWGLDVSEVCNVHDWCYHIGQTQDDKDFADMLFMRNLVRRINAHGGYLAWLRRYRAVTYYNAVAEFGDSAFWAGKDRDMQAAG